MATVHVTPLLDKVIHELDASCICGPTTDPVEDDTGRVAGFVVTHPSLDGRELTEHTWWRRVLRYVGIRRARWGVFAEDGSVHTCL